MMQNSVLIVTTKDDLSIDYFTSECVTIVYFEDDNQAFVRAVSEKPFDVVYIRDPFNVRDFQLDNIDAKIKLVKQAQPSAYYVDGVGDLNDVLIEDKWRQAQLVQEFMPQTWLGGSVDFMPGRHLAKKRLSSRSRDIVFDAAPGVLNDEWVVQEIMPIQEELRVYAVHGSVQSLASIKKSKRAAQQTKVVGLRELTTQELAFAQAIVSRVPQLDFTGLDIAVTPDGLRLIEINRSPQFKRYNELSGGNLVGDFLREVHKRTPQ